MLTFIELKDLKEIESLRVLRSSRQLGHVLMIYDLKFENSHFYGIDSTRLPIKAVGNRSRRRFK